MEKINDMINVVDYLRQDLEPQEKKRVGGKANKKKTTTGSGTAPGLFL